MSSPGYTLFDTPLGRCAVVWNASGVCGLQLPESDDAAARARLQRRFPDAEERTPPPDVMDAIAAIGRLLRREAGDLSAVRLDLAAVPPFNRRVYDYARGIPPGETATYGEIAKAIGEPGAAQAVGKALGENPCPIMVPCHRVVGADGKLGGFSAPGGRNTKLRLLEIERAFAPPDLFG